MTPGCRQGQEGEKSSSQEDDQGCNAADENEENFLNLDDEVPGWCLFPFVAAHEYQSNSPNAMDTLKVELVCIGSLCALLCLPKRRGT